MTLVESHPISNSLIRVLSIRRLLSALFALLYLLLTAGGESLQHRGGSGAPAHAEAHYHAQGDGGHDCPPPPHDENHCPACTLTGLRCILTDPRPGELATGWITPQVPRAGDEVSPGLRSHAPPRSRAPPLG